MSCVAQSLIGNWVVIENYMLFVHSVGEISGEESLIQFMKHVVMCWARLDDADSPTWLSVIHK